MRIRKIQDIPWSEWGSIARGYRRYALVIGIFALASFYSLRIARDVVQMNISEPSVGNEEQSSVRIADIGGDVPSRVYTGVLSAQAGDYYRVIIRAEATEDVLVDISVRSILGTEKKVGGIVLKKGVRSYEQTFGVDGMYQDIVLKKADSSDESSQWDDVEIFVSDVSVTRLAITAPFELRNLNTTIFGNTTTSLFFLPMTIPSEVDASLLSGSKSIGEYFAPEVSAISAVYIQPSIVGMGGTGSYEVSISQYNDAGLSDANIVARLEFTADKLWKYADKKTPRLSRFELPVALDKNKVYFVRISAKDVVSDAKNGLELVRFGTDEEGNGGGVIALEAVTYTEVERGATMARVLSNAVIQDIGGSYLYEYRMGHATYDLLDIYSASQKVKYNDSLGMLTIPEGDGASLTYRIDTVYPLVTMNVRIVGMPDAKRDGFQVEYSFDEKTWKSVVSSDGGGMKQESDFFIDGQGSATTVFVRAVYRGEAQKNDVLGISDLHISAVLKK